MIIYSIIYASFIQCLIDRYPDYFKSTFSFCDNCGKKLNIFDLIPIFSYLKLKGRCRYCHNKISMVKLITEIVFPIVFISLRLYKDNFVVLFIIFSMLYMASLTDIKHGEIPDLCFIVISIVSFNYHIKIPLIILIIGGILSYLKLIGFGDIKLLFSLALHLNFNKFILALLITSLITLIFNRNKVIRFAPYISIGYYLVILVSK